MVTAIMDIEAVTMDIGAVTLTIMTDATIGLHVIMVIETVDIAD